MISIMPNIATPWLTGVVALACADSAVMVGGSLGGSALSFGNPVVAANGHAKLRWEQSVHFRPIATRFANQPTTPAAYDGGACGPHPWRNPVMT